MLRLDPTTWLRMILGRVIVLLRAEIVRPHAGRAHSRRIGAAPCGSANSQRRATLAGLGWLVAPLLAAGCGAQGPPPPPPGAIPAGHAIGSAVIAGAVTFTGAAPPPEEISMISDPVCASRGRGRTREDLLVGPDGGVRNAFVYVASGLEGRSFAPPASPAVLDQNGCTYIPHVLGVQAGQYLEIVNSDPTLHNVHALPEVNKEFSVGMAAQKMRIRRFFTKPEVMIHFKCDVHSWMSAYVGVVDNPFYQVTGEGGRFELAGLPAGSYTVKVWHEKLGRLEARVSLGEGERKEVALEFKP